MTATSVFLAGYAIVSAAGGRDVLFFIAGAACIGIDLVLLS